MATAFRDTRLVGIDDRGIRVGEDHQRATLTNAEVDLIHELRNPTDGAQPLSFGEIARKFEISKGTVYDIISGRKRISYATRWKRIPCTARFVEPMTAKAKQSAPAAIVETFGDEPFIDYKLGFRRAQIKLKTR